MPPRLAPVRGQLVCAALVAGAGACGIPRIASGYEASVDATLDVQYYSVGSPFGDPVLSRRRYTSTLALDLSNLQGNADPDEPVLDFRTRFRLDADYGISGAERDPASRRFLPGVAETPLDLMYAYLEGDRFLDGLVGFRLGRQYVADVLGFWSFDGALLRLALPAPLNVAISGFLGFEQRTGLPMLATPRFTADGVWRGERSDLELYQYPSFLDDSELAPAAGVAIETTPIHGFHARVAYRKVQSRSTVVVSPFLDERGELEMLEETRTASERAGASLQLDAGSVGSVSASGVYDLYVQKVSRAAASVDWFASPSLSVGADVDYDYPTYDGDSIFNWFTHGPSTRAEGRLAVAPSRVFDAAFSFGARFFEVVSDPASGEGSAHTGEHLADTLADASGRLRFGSTSVALGVVGERGDSGHRAGADLTVTKSYLNGRYATRAMVSLYDWSDALRKGRDATSFTYVLGASVRPGSPFSNGRLGAEWEHSMNRLVGQRFRFLVTLDLTVLR